ncbi:MAG: arsenosugar biosynthesis radical SAM protein ArsS [Verrucomicrobia bacterium]|nr:arsenosugar biosynthesis radical SAM protein ArsS [Verrucomicrobiota bacterium]
MNRFDSALHDRQIALRRAAPAILQINVGKLCNLTCTHCHVNAGPKRKEIMTRETVDRILDWLRTRGVPAGVHTLDLTGGAPEMIPDFRHFIASGRALLPQGRIIDRCNLTILLEPGYEGMAEFLREQRVEIVASMPCYSPKNVNEQRGDGVFDASIAALQLLNRLGYGTPGGLPLHLVYNPVGAFLPGDQAELEADYKRELRAHFGIEFHSLFTITNMPVARFASWLRHQGEYERYLQTLIEAFNPSSVDALMCRDTINVGWRGEVYDCDFNQQLKMQLRGRDREPLSLWDLDPERLEGNAILTGDHCFGCTAGAGSSCGGALVDEDPQTLAA